MLIKAHLKSENASPGPEFSAKKKNLILSNIDLFWIIVYLK